MAYIHNIYKVLAAILDPNSDPNYLKQVLNQTFDWEPLVKIGSHQLILPTIYCNLKHKKLLPILPEDLQVYLEEITSINRNRNRAILEETTSISVLFKVNAIDYVFLKGTALLVSGYYKDLGERMVGDIDILVHPDQLYKAQNLLLENEYHEVETTIGQNFLEKRHLAPLVHKTKLAAVEIHSKLLHKSVKNRLEPLSVLQRKQLINGIAICSDADLFMHIILNFQINDYGDYYNYLGLRNAYDALVISKKIPNIALKQLATQKYVRSFFDKVKVYFNLDMSGKKSLFQSMNTRFFVLKQQYNFLSKTSYFILNVIKTLGIYFNRFFIMLTNPAYCKESFKDRKRLLKIIKEKIKPF